MGGGDDAAEASAGAKAAFEAVRARHGAAGQASRGRGFGSGALKVDGKIFASLSSGDRLLLKLPAARVDALIAEGIGERFSTGPGRPKREWATIAPLHASRWVGLSDEARAFASAKAKV
jgi:hypothetical protein